MTTRVLQFIGKGQITIPQEWRAVLGMEENAVKATLDGNKIIIESLPLGEEKKWNIEWITLNTLSLREQKLIKEGRKAYKEDKKEKFITSPEFFGGSPDDD